MRINYRYFRKSDLPALIRVMEAIRQHDHNPKPVNADHLAHMADAPHLHAEENFSVALNGDEVVGVTPLMLRPDSGMAFGDITLHPDFRADDIIRTLIQRCEGRVLVRDDVPEGENTLLMYAVPDKNAYLKPVLEQSGYEEAIRQYVMQIALTGSMTKPEFPPEFAFRPFDTDQDGRAVHAVFQECFADHAGDVARIPFEEWAHQFSAPDFDPTLWYVLYQGDEIAAICLCEIKDATTGLLEVLGVRPNFRRRGLGGLLLKHAFHEFQQRGYQRVVLDVDTDNSTGAVDVYKNAGMDVESCTPHYAKVLRQ